MKWLIEALRDNRKQEGYVSDIVKLALIPLGFQFLDALLPAEQKGRNVILATVILLLLIVTIFYIRATRFSTKALAKKEFLELLEYLVVDRETV